MVKVPASDQDEAGNLIDRARKSKFPCRGGRFGRCAVVRVHRGSSAVVRIAGGACCLGLVSLLFTVLFTVLHLWNKTELSMMGLPTTHVEYLIANVGAR